MLREILSSYRTFVQLGSGAQIETGQYEPQIRRSILQCHDFTSTKTMP